MPRIFSIIRNRSHEKDKTIVPGDAIKKNISSSISNRPRFLRNRSSKIFHRIKSSKKLKNYFKSEGQFINVVGPADTFSLSEDESRSVTSSLFSPVNIDMIHTTNSSSQKNVQLLTTKSLLVSPMSYEENDDNDDAIEPSPKVHPTVIEGAGFVEENQEEQQIVEEEEQEQLVEEQEEVEHAVVEDVTAIVDQLSMEITYLQQLLEDIQTLHVIDMELKEIEILKTKIAFEKSQNELLIAHSELKEQSDIIENLMTAIVSPLPAVPTPASQPSYYATASALPELFYDPLI
jgi:hypothetical protein